MAKASLVPVNGAVVLSTLVADFNAYTIRASQAVEGVTPYGANKMAKNVGSGTPGHAYTIAAFALNKVALTPLTITDNSLLLNSLGVAMTLTLDTGVTYTGTAVVSDVEVQHGRMRTAVPVNITAVNAGDITEAWAITETERSVIEAPARVLRACAGDFSQEKNEMPANVIERPVESTGKTEKFSELSLDDVVNEILSAEKGRRRKQLVENLKAAGLGPEAIFGELESFDADEPTIFRPESPEGGWTGPVPTNFADFISNDRGILLVLDYAYAAANDGGKRPKMTSREARTVLYQLAEPFGFVFSAKEEPKKPGEAPDPNPQTGLRGYGNTP